MNKCFFGDCRETMCNLIADDVKVQMCVTSPPYFGLRDYGHPGQLGLEQTPAEYVENMVEVFSLVWYLLADDGVLWLNLGDSYAGGSTSGAPRPGSGRADGIVDDRAQSNRNGVGSVHGLKPKDLIGIPWRVAFALQEAGWYLRQDIIWHKPNPMPESVTDRCTKAHEYIFLLSKRERYYFDNDAIKEPSTTNENRPGGVVMDREYGYDSKQAVMRSKRDSFKRDDSKRAVVIPGQSVGTHRPDRDESEFDTYTRNRRSVWTVATTPYSGAHFATFPPALIEPCILAGSRVGDIVLDPFFGSGTTGQVSQALGRQWIGCELNPDYSALQSARTSQQSLMLEVA